MFALIYQALLRFFGFGGAVAVKPPLAGSPRYSPAFRHLLNQAKALKNRPPPEPMRWTEAVGILARRAGQHPAWEAPPPEWRVILACAVLPSGVLAYLHLLEILGRAFPKAGSDDDAAFERRLRQLVRTDVAAWLAGLWSGKALTVPAHITAVMIQRAANALGQPEPQVMQEGQRPHFVADAETQMCVIDRHTQFCVLPRVIGRGDTDLIEVPGTDKRFHRETVMHSYWEFRLGYAGQVFEPPVIPDAADDGADAVAELVPHEIPNQVQP